MSDQYPDTMEPLRKTDADLQRRLINFQTGSSQMRPGHTQWLDTLLRSTPATREFHCHIYGFASKLGSTASNETLALDRVREVARYLEAGDPKYTTRIETYDPIGELDPTYIAGERDDDARWRAVEVHVKLDRPPRVKPGAKKIPGPARTNMKWSISGYFNLMASVWHVAQFGIGLFKFRNDETSEVRTYLSPMAGAGGGYDVLKLLKWLKAIGDKKLPKWAHLDHLVEKIMSDTRLLSDPGAVLKEIGREILTGIEQQDWTDFTKCEVYQPLSFNKLHGKAIGNVSGTPGVYQLQKIFVYGQVWYVEKSGKKMFGTRNLLSANSAGWVAQVPALAGGAVGGPLLLL